MAAPTPIRIEPHGERELLLAWSDGTRHAVPYAELRFLCPCASCVDEHTGERIIRRESVREGVRPRSVVPVGRYAIQFGWSDGHGTGIYPFDLLLAAGRSFPAV